MTEYTLHCFAESGNAYKVALMLELTGQDWAPVFVDFFHGQTRGQDWRDAVNEQGRCRCWSMPAKSSPSRR